MTDRRITFFVLHQKAAFHKRLLATALHLGRAREPRKRIAKMTPAEREAEVKRLQMQLRGEGRMMCKIGIRLYGHCPTMLPIALVGILTRCAHSRSSPAPTARRFAAVRLDRSARPSRQGYHVGNGTL